MKRLNLHPMQIFTNPKTRRPVLVALFLAFFISMNQTLNLLGESAQSSLREAVHQESNAIPLPIPETTDNPKDYQPTNELIRGGGAKPETAADISSKANRVVKKIPVYTSSDFLTGYLSNRTYPIIVDGKPWINASTNVAQYRNERGGTTFWDFWGEAEEWETTNHMWQDDQGEWHFYQKESIETQEGREVRAFILVDRKGPGVMDMLWFTHDTVIWSGDILQHLRILGTRGVEESAEWGNLSKLGKLWIQVDDKIVFDGPIEDWFSGKAQGLSPDLAKIFVWHFQQFGSTGNIIPIPYQKHLKVAVYGGKDKPKWFMATGMTLPKDTRVKSFTGNVNDLPLDEMTRLAHNVLEPENYVNQFENQSYEFRVQKNSPAVIRLNGSGTVQAIQFRVPQSIDPAQLWLQVKYGNEIAMDLPFVAFFGEHEHLSPHRSSPIGIVDSKNFYLFYSNFPWPYQDGMTIQVSATNPVSLSARVATSSELFNTQFRVLNKPSEKLQAFGPDYQVRLKGNGKLVGLVLVTSDQKYNAVQHLLLPGTNIEDPATHIWPMGYLEANLLMLDGAGNSRLYSGQEDWVGGGYYFNLGFTTPSGGGNRPFGGILRYKDGEDGYATLFRRSEERR